MKLLNYTSGYFAFILMIVIPVLAGIFYFALLDEVYDSMDDGLDNQRQLIISKAAMDSTITTHYDFEEGSYAIKPISAFKAALHTDIYADTMMYMQNEKDFEPVRMLQTVFRQGERYYQLRVITSMVEEDDLIKQLTYSLLWLYFGLILTILLLNNFLLRNIWKPFHRIIGQLQDFKLNNIQLLKPVKTNVEEFNVMQEAVQHFVDNNIAVYNQQKQFIENASHELQTPLAIAINKLELLAEDSTLKHEEAELLNSALNNLERLKRLNQSLLLLSKIENDQYKAPVEINLSNLTKQLIEDFTDQIDFYGLRLDFRQEGDFCWKINPDLADILISNLIKNAIRHTKGGGVVTIIAYDSEIIIENEGTAPLNGSLIFDRFYKDSSSASSTGLGLAIAKAVTLASRLKLSYHFAGKHIFIISPLTQNS